MSRCRCEWCERLPPGKRHDLEESLGQAVRERDDAKRARETAEIERDLARGALWRLRRVAAGLSLRDVATRMGITAMALGEYERGRRPIDSATRRALAEAIGVRNPIEEAVERTKRDEGSR